MRCPACGFISFDSLSVCKQCGKELPRRREALGGIVAPRGKTSPPLPSMEGPAPSGPLQSAEKIAAPAVADEAEESDARELASPRTAGFWFRSVAFFVDTCVVGLFVLGGVMLVGMAVQIGGVASAASEAGLEWLDATATRCLVWMAALCYFTLFVGWRGQTPGKMLLGLKIVRTTGQEVGYGRALIRWVGQCLGLLPLGLGFLMVAFSRQKQGFHDKLAGTIVIRTPS